MLLKAQGRYDLRSVTFSHGWSDLPPFRVEGDDGTVRAAIRSAKGPVVVRVAPIANGIEINRKISSEDAKALRRMLRLDDDLSGFYGHTAVHGREWISAGNMGRMLRSQTVFEDLIKLILTTNCSWSLTRIMTGNLAEHLGDEADGIRLFPDAEALAAKPEKFYREKIRAGYRSPHLPAVAKMVLKKKLDPESWLDPEKPTETVRKEILSVPGAGPYVADNLCRFLGRYDFLGLDSWARGKLKKMWKMKKVPPDKTIERRYKPHGAFKGLVLWCDLTRDWFESNQFSSWVRVE